jgi:hypothetical protein
MTRRGPPGTKARCTAQDRDAHAARLPVVSAILLIVKAIQLGGG